MQQDGNLKIFTNIQNATKFIIAHNILFICIIFTILHLTYLIAISTKRIKNNLRPVLISNLFILSLLQNFISQQKIVIETDRRTIKNKTKKCVRV